MAGILFHQIIVKDQSPEFIASRCEVSTDGYFFNVITDDYEGHAMFTLPVALEVHIALGQAIEVAQEKRRDSTKVE